MTDQLQQIYDSMADRLGLPAKAAYGSPCNSCGACCFLQQCALSELLFGTQPLCPAITAVPGKVTCGLISSPASFVPDHVAELTGEFAALVLGTGTGCDSAHTDAEIALSDAYDYTPFLNETKPKVEALLDQLAAKLNGMPLNFMVRK